jgi:hypothetical protein
VQIEKLAETSFPSFSVRKPNRYINLTLSFRAFYSKCHSELAYRSAKIQKKKRKGKHTLSLLVGHLSRTRPAKSPHQIRRRSTTADAAPAARSWPFPSPLPDAPQSYSRSVILPRHRRAPPRKFVDPPPPMKFLDPAAAEEVPRSAAAG